VVDDELVLAFPEILGRYAHEAVGPSGDATRRCACP
jgi:hypothetical protein